MGITTTPSWNIGPANRLTNAFRMSRDYAVLKLRLTIIPQNARGYTRTLCRATTCVPRLYSRTQTGQGLAALQHRHQPIETTTTAMPTTAKVILYIQSPNIKHPFHAHPFPKRLTTGHGTKANKSTATTRMMDECDIMQMTQRKILNLHC
jgi:hypothetical protein